MWIGRKEFDELKRKVEKLTERNSSVESEVFDVVSAPLFFIDNCGKKHRDGDVFTTIPLVSKDIIKIRENANFIEKMLPFYKQCGLYFLFLNSILLLCEYKKILDEMES
jgi:hypothetical protein